MARHHAAGEEMLRDPVLAVGAIEQIGAGAVGEDVHEEAAVRLQPGAHAGQQLAPVHHVLEHLDRDDAVEALARGSNSFMSAVTTRRLFRPRFDRLGLDVFALRVRIRHRRDLRMRKLPRHPQRQRAPAAAEFEDRLAVGELGMLDGLAQRLFLGLLQGRGRLLVEARRIFAVRARARARRTPPALRSAARWPRRCTRRWRARPSRRRTSASLSASPLASRAAVREHSRWIAARMMTSGSGTRSAVPMMVETKLM